MRNPQMHQIQSSAFPRVKAKDEWRDICENPICGMEVEAATAAGQSEENGQQYYFCSTYCKERFDLNPMHFLGKSAATPKSGEGCCAVGSCCEGETERPSPMATLAKNISNGPASGQDDFAMESRIVNTHGCDLRHSQGGYGSRNITAEK